MSKFTRQSNKFLGSKGGNELTENSYRRSDQNKLLSQKNEKNIKQAESDPLLEGVGGTSDHNKDKKPLQNDGVINSENIINYVKQDTEVDNDICELEKLVHMQGSNEENGENNSLEILEKFWKDENQQ